MNLSTVRARRLAALAAAAVTLTLTAPLPAAADAEAVVPVVGAPPALGVVAAATSEETAADAEQVRNDTALARWQRYRDRLDRAGVRPPRARALAHPERRLPAGLLPVVRRGAVVPGVAAAPLGGRTVRVLPRETLTAVDHAFANLGKPYRPGRRGPRAYGCGGYTAAMWQNAGVTLGTIRPTRQYRTGRVVPRGQIQIGDLGYIGTPGTGFQHVGIYVGKGLMLAADGATGRVAAISAAPVTAASRPTLPGPAVANPAERPARGIACGRSTTSLAEMANGLVLPVAEGTFRYTATWGQRGPHWSSGYHTGLDFAAPTGTPVVAPAGGWVRVRDDQAWWAGPYFVQIDHGNGMVTWYAHLSYAAVQDGQQVQAGQLVGLIGSEGNSTGPHLHFEMHADSSLSPYRNGPSVDPLPYLTARRPWPLPTVPTDSPSA